MKHWAGGIARDELIRWTQAQWKDVRPKGVSIKSSYLQNGPYESFIMHYTFSVQDDTKD